MFNISNGKITAVIFFTALAVPTITTAEQIELRSYDGSASMAGKPTGYNDGLYQLETALGSLMIAASRVQCEGAACPLASTVLSDLQAAQDEQLCENGMPTDILTN